MMNAADSELLDACRVGSVEKASSALARGANPAVLHPQTERTPLISAAIARSAPLVMLLLGSERSRSPECVNHSDRYGMTALAWSAQSGDYEICRALLSAGATPSRNNAGARAQQKIVRRTHALAP